MYQSFQAPIQFNKEMWSIIRLEYDAGIRTHNLLDTSLHK